MLVLMDLHSHCNFSPDSEETLANMIQRAKELQLSVYAITDHCEMNRFYDEEHYTKPRCDYSYDIYGYQKVKEHSITAVDRAKQEHPDLHLLCGIELGQSIYDIEASERVVSDPRLDFVLASLHELYDKQDFAFLKYDKEDVSELLHRYFEDLWKITEWGKFDSLSHLTYTLRYIEGEQGIPVDISSYEEQIRAIYQNLILKKKALEINTSGYRQAYGDSFPNQKLLKIYYEMGGRMITLGSDAHRACDVAKGISEGMRMAKEIGFEYVTYFEKHEPKKILL